jgi:hypothetical protein
MGNLGSIFAEDPADADKPRGEDLYFVVEVPRNYLGDPDGFLADIPEEIEKDGVMVKRAVVPGDDGVPLRLPEDFPSGRTLRLRRQGGVVEGGLPGDLFVKIELGEPDERSLLPAGPSDLARGQDVPSLTPWFLGLGLFILVALGFAMLIL